MENCSRVGKGVSPCLLCASVDVMSLLGAEKILTEYLNNRDSIMSKMVHSRSGQFGQFLAH